MKNRFSIFIICTALSFVRVFSFAAENTFQLHFIFFDDTIDVTTDSSVIVDFNDSLSEKSVESFYTVINASYYQPIIKALISYKEKNKLSDWLYYQLIRKTAQQIAPKAMNYYRYTLYKWFLLSKSGFDATLDIRKNMLLFYVYSNENIYDIPLYKKDDKQYVCLNCHDYGRIEFNNDTIREISIKIPEGKNAFSYKITSMPDFNPADYSEKDLQFVFRRKLYHFKVMMNPEVQTIFANYPIVDFESYFNIPLTKETYSSLIPSLKKNVSRMSCKEGVDYLMRFTRNAFLYENDQDNFGKEKRLSPEETLLNQYSDCDDRVALFFYLVKEIYNLPMIALLYPTHITIAVKFNTPVGKTVAYNGNKYSFCDPTAQTDKLGIGNMPAAFDHVAYQVVYEYDPQKK